MTENAQQTWGKWAEAVGLHGVVPEAMHGRPWRPTAADATAAWTLYTELRTRITTQPLHYRSGDDRTALLSVAGLFATCRRLIDEHGPECVHFADLATLLLNHHVRPFTARWHKEREDVFRSEDDRHRFRTQLRGLQQTLLRFTHGLRVLSGAVADLAEPAPPPSRPIGESRQQSRSPGDQESRAASAKIRSFEAGLIGAAGAGPAQDGDAATPDVDLLGLALSGGGVRSAAFCLGVLQALAEGKLLREVDYLSTVSGGGYIGGFWSQAVARGNGGGPDALFAPGSDEVRSLRRRSKNHLLGPRPIASVFRIVLTFGAGWVTSAAVLVLLVAVGVGLAYAGRSLGLQPGWTGAVWPWAGFVLVALFAGCALRPYAEGRPRLVHRVTIAVLLAVAILGAVQLTAWLREASGETRMPWATGAIVVGAAVLARVLRFPRVAAVLAAVVLTLLVPLLTVWGWLWAVELYVDGQPSRLAVGIGILAVAGALVLCLADVNATSPHGFYRDRIADTFLPGDPIAVGELPEAGPYHLIQATVNLPASDRDELRGRKSDLFLFSRHAVGSAATRYRPATRFEKLDLATAIAISGAAASSHMGRLSARSRVPLLTLLNIRLGYWLRNPDRRAIRKTPGLQYLWRELLGRLDEGQGFWNVSDGGHLENLGLYELLRRRCRYIIAVDAEADPQLTCAGLIHCRRLARIDMGVEIDIDLRDLELEGGQLSRAHFQLGVIDYGSGAPGYLLYLKASVTGDEQDDVLDYRRRNPAFPHESTTDQFFSEEQFEAYRMLGQHVGERATQEELRGDGGIAPWFQRMRDMLLPDDHDSLAASAGVEDDRARG